MRITQLSDAIAFLRRQFPEATSGAESPGAAADGLPQPLVELFAALGGAIGRPIQVHGLTRPSLLHISHFLQSQDSLLPSSKLKQDDDGRWIIAVENQNSWDWRVAFTSGDTPVLSACADNELSELREVNPLLSEFLQGFLLREAVFGSKFRKATRAFADVAGLEPLKLGCRVVNATSDFYFLRGGEVLVNHEAGTWWFGSNSTEPL